MHPILQAMNKAVPEATTARFFSEIAPSILAQRAEGLRALGGRYAFHVRGEGAWTLNFDSAQVEAGLPESPDTFLDLSPEAFVALMKGTLDVKAAIGEGLLVFQGSRADFMKLTAALRPTI